MREFWYICLILGATFCAIKIEIYLFKRFKEKIRAIIKTYEELKKEKQALEEFYKRLRYRE